MQYRSLGSTGLKLSILSFGGSGYGKVYGHFDECNAVNALKYGLDSGINYIDTAPWYGQGLSESFLGKALQGVERSKYYIGTKVGRYERNIPEMFDFSAKRVSDSIHESLRRLNVDYVDILQIHDVEFAPSVEMILQETLPALDLMRKRGLCRHIGITGYPLSILKEIILKSEITIDTILSYCRLTLNDSSLIQDLGFYESKSIGVINASPLSMGLLAPEFIQDWHPASSEIKHACFEAVKYCKQNGVDISRIALNYSTKFKPVIVTYVKLLSYNYYNGVCECARHSRSDFFIKN